MNVKYGPCLVCTKPILTERKNYDRSECTNSKCKRLCWDETFKFCGFCGSKLNKKFVTGFNLEPSFVKVADTLNRKCSINYEVLNRYSEDSRSYCFYFYDYVKQIGEGVFDYVPSETTTEIAALAEATKEKLKPYFEDIQFKPWAYIIYED